MRVSKIISPIWDGVRLIGFVSGWRGLVTLYSFSCRRVLVLVKFDSVMIWWYGLSASLLAPEMPSAKEKSHLRVLEMMQW